MAGQEEMTDPPSTLIAARGTTANKTNVGLMLKCVLRLAFWAKKRAENCAVNETADCISINLILCFLIKPPNRLMAFTCAHFVIVGHEK